MSLQHPFRLRPPSRIAARCALAFAFATACTASLAGPSVVDPIGDFLPTYTGVKNGDLDVVSATVLYDTATSTFTLSSTQAGAVGTTPSAIYVWGVDTGTGTAGFASIGVTGVYFNSVIILRATGTSTVAGTALPSGSVTVSGNTISASFSSGLLSGSLLPNKYLWNLWPRDSSVAGTAAISDFAPDNASFTAAAVPEPASLGLMAAGLGLLAWRRRPTR